MIVKKNLELPGLSLCWLLIFFIFIMSLMVSLPSAHGSEKREVLRNKLDGLLESLGSGDEYDPEKLIDFGFLPGPLYTPELELGIGLAAIGLYKTDREDEKERVSSFSITGFGSITKAIGLVVENQTFFLRDRVRFFIDGRIFNAPEKYWGVGYDLNNDEDSEEEYTDVTFQISPRVYHRIFNAIYLGAGWDFVRNQALDTEAEGLFYQENPYGTEVYSSGYSLHIMSDTRDSVLNAYEGHLLNLDYYDYKESFGSDSDYSVTEFTFNTYKAVSDKDILAFQFFVKSADHDVPWSRLSRIGGASQMRGYWEGRYRDKKMITSQIEYRRKLYWRHGIVFWIGAGAIAPSFDDFDSDQILPNAGIGYRLAFKNRSNVRLDLGFSKNMVGFYFNVNEAF